MTVPCVRGVHGLQRPLIGMNMDIGSGAGSRSERVARSVTGARKEVAENARFSVVS